jgi:uncharacterized protein (TIGR02270 family)
MLNSARVIIEEIVEQHVDECAFLWSVRDAATSAAHYWLKDLAEIEERVEAHLDGLRVAGEAGWTLSAETMADDEPGSVFTAGVIAFESGDGHRIDEVVNVGKTSLPAFRGMVSALGWIDDGHFHAILPALLHANSQHYQRLAIAACGIRREDPGDALAGAIKSEDLFLRSRALKTAGELKRLDLLPLVQENFHHPNHICRFAAARTSVLLGDRSAMDILRAFVHSKSKWRLPAMQIALRILDVQTALEWLRPMARHEDHLHDVLVGSAITGDPAYINSIISQMEKPELARMAGQAFAVITGVNLAAENLDRESPDDFEAGPNDDPDDEDTAPDPDEDLPWPDTARLTQWWNQHHGDYSAAMRYLAGKPISPEHCRDILRHGNQVERLAAALELALSEPSAPYVNVRGKADRQLAALRSLAASA